MATLDEITEERQRIGEALARVDAQREKLTAQLSELEATERVLARYNKSPQTRGRARGAAKQAAASPADGAPGGLARELLFVGMAYPTRLRIVAAVSPSGIDRRPYLAAPCF